MSGGFSVAEFQKKLVEESAESPAEESTGDDGDDDSDKSADGLEEASEAKKSKAAPMAQILRPISLKDGRKKAEKNGEDVPEESEASEEAEPSEAEALAEESEPANEAASNAATDQDDLYVEAELDVEGFPSIEIEAPIHDDHLGGSNSSFAEDLEQTAEQLDSPKPHEAFIAAEQIAGFGDAAMGILEERFPGRLLVDRYQYTIETMPPVSEHGPVLAALSQAKEAAVPVAASFLEHTSVELRFYATYLFTKLPLDEVVDQFILRLFDRDHQTREIAKKVILDRRDQAWFQRQVLPILYDAIAAGTEELKLEVAADLLGALRERGAVPLLIDCLDGHEGRVKDHIHRALRQITFKNFVPSVSEWKNWWIDAQQQSRTDWMVAALNSNSAEIRELVHREVQGLDGLELNYHPDQPAKLRGRAQEELRKWLQQS